ncbi:MAG TPA: SDR family oxidoreductase [Thermoleophilaceae bacterium]
MGAVVTGASSGVGRAIAARLAADGAAVCLVGRDEQRLREAAAEAEGSLTCRADLTEDRGVEAVAETAQRELPGVDVLVHAAAIIETGPLESASLADFDAQYQANVRAPYALTQALLDRLREREGQIVFINSTAGARAAGGSGQYAASKHGLRAIADSLREEVNADRLRVLTVLLGRTATPMQAALHDAEGRPYRPDLLIQPADVAAMVAAVLALPRTTEVTEIRLRPLAKT